MMNEQTIPPVHQPPDPKNWVAMYADYLFAYTITRIQDEEQARDLVQETFLAGLQGLQKYAGKSSERTWLTGILKNKIIDVYRKKSSGLKTQEINTADGEVLDFFNGTDGHWKQEHRPQNFGLNDFDPLANKELNQVLQRCMRKLPALWLSVFTMKHMDDEETDVVCAELRISSANFWVIIHRAKLNLRACLQKNWM
ncbi:sigma-70 family RNA polymerase sigma factor [Mucilaginibacter glaciei]|uniref:Sigma-70 family RNA polymerase sigma factor n=1 Tax=Mucilaginibacter glaciei TaxID=2772109 RepID=A0A926NT27_9SPHI|nr:sigma-70 family RNA polymerase sigma factor [Mucilaginibacter glaciei]MBD1394205.1 sigma-70 family RNA polymerase sigma factor [Mucilaginibacter glaciei]